MSIKVIVLIGLMISGRAYSEDQHILLRAKTSYNLNKEEMRWISEEYKKLKKDNLEIKAGNAREADKVQWQAIDLFFEKYGFYDGRKQYVTDIHNYSKLALFGLAQKQKFVVQATCQVNQKGLLELHDQKNLAKTKFYLQMMEYLAQETDKRCRAAWMKYVDIKNQLKSRSEEASEASGFIKTKSEKVP